MASLNPTSDFRRGVKKIITNKDSTKRKRKGENWFSESRKLLWPNEVKKIKNTTAGFLPKVKSIQHWPCAASLHSVKTI